MHVYPGLIAANTQLGLVEIGAVRATLDYNETGDVAPEVRAAVSVNPDSTIIPVTRLNGILTAGVFPLGGTIPGRASVIRMDGWTWEDLAIEQDAGLVVNWPWMRVVEWRLDDKSAKQQRKEAMERVDELKQIFEDAEAYLTAKDNDKSIPDRPPLGGDAPLRSAIPSASSSAPTSSSRSIRRQLGDEKGYTITIMGGRDAHLCTDLLKRNHDVGVIVTGTHRLPSRRDAVYEEAYALPAQLEEAGVRGASPPRADPSTPPTSATCPTTPPPPPASASPTKPPSAPSRSPPREMLGVDDRLGSIEPGKAATLIITTGDPLEITTEIERAFIDGREIDLRSKHTELYEKYREKYRQLDLIDD